MEFNWQTKDGIQIYGKDWMIENPKAVIALVHGFGEHCRRYDSMANYYNERQYAMLGYDRRGHGQSSGPRGHTPNYDCFLDEIDSLIVECKQRYPGKPIVIYGHSMGGNLVLNYMIKRPNPDIQLTIVTGPWIQLTKEPPGILKAIVRLIRKLSPTFAQENKIGIYISRVQEEVDKYMNDPLVHGRISVNLACEMFKWSDYLYHYKGALTKPTLIMHAGEDKLTSLKATEKFVQNVDGDISFKIWEDLYHEIHNESVREQVYNYAIDWLGQKL